MSCLIPSLSILLACQNWCQARTQNPKLHLKDTLHSGRSVFWSFFCPGGVYQIVSSLQLQTWSILHLLLQCSPLRSCSAIAFVPKRPLPLLGLLCAAQDPLVPTPSASRTPSSRARPPPSVWPLTCHKISTSTRGK